MKNDCLKKKTKSGEAVSIQDFILLIIALIGCFVGLAGYLSSRDKHITDDAQWKGTVDQSLKDIKDGVSGVGERMAKVEGAIATLNTQNAIHSTRLKEHDTQIQELKQIIADKEKTA